MLHWSLGWKYSLENGYGLCRGQLGDSPHVLLNQSNAHQSAGNRLNEPLLLLLERRSLPNAEND